MRESSLICRLMHVPCMRWAVFEATRNYRNSKNDNALATKNGFDAKSKTTRIET